MRRTWPLALLLLPATGWLLHPELTPGSLAKHARSGPSEELEPSGEDDTGQALPPLLQAALPEAEPVLLVVEDPPERPYHWRESATLRSLVWLARHQNEDGSWGDGPAVLGDQTIGRSGITAMALLSFLGGGYSHLSRDQYDEQEFGSTIRSGLNWLLNDQQENGRFRSVQGGGLDQAIASYALLEAYGMTAAQFLKDPSQQALNALTLLQKADGSWGGEGSTAWAFWSLRSAEANEQPFAAEAKALAVQYAAGSSEPGVADSRMKWTRKRTTEDQLQLMLLGAPQSLSFDRLHYGTMAAYRFDGPEGPVWKQWRDGMTAAVLQTQEGDGSWEGGSPSQSLVLSCLALQTLQVYYTYRPAVFGADR